MPDGTGIARRVRGRVGCYVEGCSKPHKAKGYCTQHYRNFLATGAPIAKGRGWRTGVLSPHWTEDPTYMGVHSRLKAQRGRAADQQCPCGSAARQWAYNHLDPNERHEMVNGYLLPYSVDLAYYEPLCTYCHRGRDLQHTTQRSSSGKIDNFCE